MRNLVYIAACCVLLMTAACSKQYRAQGVVKDFMKENMAEGVRARAVSFHGIDSTRRINDSTICAMRVGAEASGRYRKGIAYADGEGVSTCPLIISRVSYYVDTVECYDTYYLDSGMTTVIAVKVTE